MLRFFEGNEKKQQWLREQIQGRLYTFYQVRLPANCTPSFTRLGFEYTPQNGYILYIDKGIAYTGDHIGLKNLITAGEKRFEEYDQMIGFIKGLKPLFDNSNDVKNVIEKPFLQAKQTVKEVPNLSQIYDRNAIVERPAETGQIFLDSDKIYEDLTKRIKGQDQCMKALAEIASIHLAQSEPKMPATVFLAGPTGTGKTESANVLFNVINKLSAKPYQMIRINCNQYKEPHRVAQLLGSPNGYIGYGDPPAIAAIANNPRAIVLWDEIEKAHNDVLDVIMGAMDTGIIQLPSAYKGVKDLDCKRSIFLFTSNIPINQPKNAVGFNNTSIEDVNMDTDEMCKKTLVSYGIKPEIAGRILAYLVFNSLKGSVIADIIAIAMVDCAQSFGLDIMHIDAQIIQDLLDYNQTSFGARTYKQDIQKKLGKAFALASQKSKRKIALKGTIASPVIENASGGI